MFPAKAALWADTSPAPQSIRIADQPLIRSPRVRTHASVAFFEICYAAIAIAWLSQINLSIAIWTSNSTQAYEDRSSGTLFNQVGSLAVFVPSLYLLLARFSVSFERLRTTIPLWLLTFLPMMSSLWSLEPATSLRRGTQLLLSVIFIFWCATRFDPRSFIRILSATFAILMLASLFAILVPGLGLEYFGPHVGSVRGILPTKNDFGIVAALACITFYFHASMERLPLKACLRAMAFVTVVMLWFANARSPLIALLAALPAAWFAAFLWAPRGWQKRFTWDARTLLSAIAIALSVLVVTSTGLLILQSMGRDINLTGRWHLWDYALSRPIPSPTLGAGYRSFWGDHVTFDLRVLHAHWTGNRPDAMNLTSNGHNGYLDTWLEMGLPGTIFIGCFLIYSIILSLHSVAITRSFGQFHFSVIFIIIVYSFANTVIMSPSHIAWCLPMYFAFIGYYKKM